jgi:ribosomal protein L40E
MPRVAHRVTPNRVRELRERVVAMVERKLAGKVICARCGATIKTYADKCSADLDERCPGFEAVDIVQMAAEREVGLTGSQS